MEKITVFQASLDCAAKSPKVTFLTCLKQSSVPHVPPELQTKPSLYFPVCCVGYETGSHSVALVGLELLILFVSASWIKDMDHLDDPLPKTGILCAAQAVPELVL